ncbi:alpha/beta hydrolase [Kitasatospora sp. NPDC093550]|uniref:alpha/beta hydrolase n=1 Tax=Kitasatospora sp. NPDC093550 TaxID=3364089 RepID=UPI0037F9EBFE
MDRFVRALIQWQAGSRPEPARTLPVARLRERYAEQATQLSRGSRYAGIETKDQLIDGGDGEFGVRTYLPPTDRGRLVTYLHGGGWVVGDVDTHDPVCRRIAAELGAVVVSVDYRRAPEHPHPGPLRDGIAASEWADRAFPGRLHVIAGDSAGGALAVGISMHHRDHGGVGFAGQLLVYPPADPELRSRSAREYGTGYLSEVDDLRWYYDQYVPDPAHRTAPEIDLLGADHRGLPPAVIGTAGFDPLYDEGVELAERMAAHGVLVRQVSAPGLVHGYLLMADTVPAADQATADVLAAVEDLLASAPTAP